MKKYVIDAGHQYDITRDTYTCMAGASNFLDIMQQASTLYGADYDPEKLDRPYSEFEDELGKNSFVFTSIWMALGF